MQNQKEDKTMHCIKPDCGYNIPFVRPHVHVITNNGEYVQYIIEKPKPIFQIGD